MCACHSLLWNEFAITADARSMPLESTSGKPGLPPFSSGRALIGAGRRRGTIPMGRRALARRDRGSRRCRRRLLARRCARRSRPLVRGRVDGRRRGVSRRRVGAHRLRARVLAAAAREPLRAAARRRGLRLVPARVEQPRDRLGARVHGRPVPVRCVPAARRPRSARLSRRPARLAPRARRRRGRVRRRRARPRRPARARSSTRRRRAARVPEQPPRGRGPRRARGPTSTASASTSGSPGRSRSQLSPP